MRERFDQRLDLVDKDVLIMGWMVRNAILAAVEALTSADQRRAREVEENDERIDQRRRDVEQECVELIATQAPVARDVRRLVGALEVIGELEQVGDYAKDIARVCIMLGPLAQDFTVDLGPLGSKTASYLQRAVVAFVHRDRQAAEQVMDDLRSVAILCREAMDTLSKPPEGVQPEIGNYGRWAVHSLDRAASRARHVAESTLYVITGEMERSSGWGTVSRGARDAS